MNNISQHYHQNNYLKRLLRLTVASLLFWLFFYIIWQLIILLMVISSSTPVSSFDISPFIAGTFFALIIFVCGLPCQLIWLFLTAQDNSFNTNRNTIYALIASLMNGLCFAIFELSQPTSTPISIAVVVSVLSVVCSILGSYFILLIYQKLYGQSK